jgi:VWFA-related protein
MRWRLTLAWLVIVFGKTGSPQATLPPKDEFQFRISVNLVQVDATVTDSHGVPVPGLAADDFRILLDGKPQRIVSSSFIEAGKQAPATPPPAVRQPAVSRKLDAAMPSMPAAPLKREDVRRTIVLFVDDYSMSSETVPRVRAGLHKFVEKQMRPGDLVAIVRASAGLGALQDFTTDRDLLLAAADLVRWNPIGRGKAGAYQDTPSNPTDDRQQRSSLGRQEAILRIENAAVATASSLWRLVRGMSPLPGRKSVVVLADSLPLRTPDEVDPWGTPAVGSGMSSRILPAMRRVVDESVRAGVVLYAIDTRGLSSLTMGGGSSDWASECLGGGPGTMPGLGARPGCPADSLDR